MFTSREWLESRPWRKGRAADESRTSNFHAERQARRDAAPAPFGGSLHLQAWASDQAPPNNDPFDRSAEEPGRRRRQAVRRGGARLVEGAGAIRALKCKETLTQPRAPGAWPSAVRGLLRCPVLDDAPPVRLTVQARAGDFEQELHLRRMKKIRGQRLARLASPGCSKTRVRSESEPSRTSLFTATLLPLSSITMRCRGLPQMRGLKAKPGRLVAAPAAHRRTAPSAQPPPPPVTRHAKTSAERAIRGAAQTAVVHKATPRCAHSFSLCGRRRRLRRTLSEIQLEPAPCEPREALDVLVEASLPLLALAEPFLHLRLGSEAGRVRPGCARNGGRMRLKRDHPSRGNTGEAQSPRARSAGGSCVRAAAPASPAVLCTAMYTPGTDATPRLAGRCPRCRAIEWTPKRTHSAGAGQTERKAHERVRLPRLAVLGRGLWVPVRPRRQAGGGPRRASELGEEEVLLDGIVAGGNPAWIEAHRAAALSEVLAFVVLDEGEAGAHHGPAHGLAPVHD